MTPKFLALLLLIASPVSAVEPVIDILAVAGKSKQQVSGVLGKPQSCGRIKYGEKCVYKKGETEIVYISGKADWISVNAMDGVTYDATALSALSLKAANPTFQSKFSTRWKSLQGLREVSVFSIGNTVDYAYIKVRTE